MTTRSGFTLIELIVGMAVSVIVFVAALSFYTYLVRINSAQSSSESLAQVQNDLAQELVNSIRWANSLTVTPTEITINTTDVYSFSSGQIFKNGTPLTPSNLTVTAFTLTNHSTSPVVKSFKLVITIQNPVSLHQVTLDTVISQRQSILSI